MFDQDSFSVASEIPERGQPTYSVDHEVSMFDQIGEIEVSVGQKPGRIRTKGRSTCSSFGLILLGRNQHRAILTHHQAVTCSHALEQLKLRGKRALELEDVMHVIAVSVTDDSRIVEDEAALFEQMLKDLCGRNISYDVTHKVVPAIKLKPGGIEVKITLQPPGATEPTIVFADNAGKLHNIPKKHRDKEYFIEVE